MRVTIIADASWCPQTHVAGYGFWIASDRGKQGGSGAMRNTVVNNNAAEMMALINGLHHACKTGLVQACDAVLLQTDCQAAIHALVNAETRKHISKTELELVAYFKELQDRVGFNVEFRHVKGHTDGKQPRLFINNKCDEFARKAMRKARHEFYKNQKEQS